MKTLLLKTTLVLVGIILQSQAFSQYGTNYRAARHPFELGGTYKKAYTLANQRKHDSAYTVMRGLADSLLVEKNWKDYLKAQNELATMYAQHMKPQKAIEVLDEATKNIKPHISPLSTEMVYTYKVYWFAYRFLEDLEELKRVQGFRYYQVENRTKEHDETGYDLCLDVDTYDEISISFLQTSQMEKHYDCIEKAFSLAEDLNWTRRINVLYGQLGIYMLRDGYYDYAEDFLVKAIDENKLKRYYDSVMAVHDYSSLSSIYLNKGEYRKSLASLDFSKKIILEHPHPFPGLLGLNDLKRGHTYKEMGIIDSADYYYKKALEELEKNKKLSETVESYINLADLYMKHYNNPDSAKQFIAEAKVIMQANKTIDREIIEEYYTFLTDYYREQGLSKEATKQAHQGLSSLGDSAYADTNRFSAPEIPINTFKFATLTLYEAKIKALIAYFEKTEHPEDLKILKEHFKQYDRYFLIFMNENTNKQKIKNSLAAYRKTLDMIIDFYHISNQLKPGDKETLFALITRGKGIEMLIEKHQIEFNKLMEKHDTSDFDFVGTKDRIFTIENQLEILDEKKYTDTIEVLTDELLRLRRIALLKEAQLKFKAHQNIETIAFEELKPAQIQNKLTRNEALLEYHLTDDYIHINSVTKETYNHFVIKTGNLEQQISRAYRSIKTGETQHQVLAELYELLIKPAEQSIRNKKQLIIVADKKLNEIPFDLLRNPNNYLLENYAISYAYASSLIQSDAEETQKFDYHMVGIAPIFDPVNHSVAMRANYRDLYEEDPDIFRPGGGQLKSLPHTKTEIDEIAKIFSKSKQKTALLYGGKARKENLFQYLSKARIIHIATHGLLNKTNPYLSGLVLYPEKVELEQSDIFYHYELYDKEVNAELVVLSACKTGIGEIVEGEGVMALPRGFIHTGVPNVIASLWKVHDKKTKALMVAFYKHLLEEDLSYAEALRQAKLDCIKKGFLPLDWAGFVLIES